MQPPASVCVCVCVCVFKTVSPGWLSSCWNNHLYSTLNLHRNFNTWSVFYGRNISCCFCIDFFFFFFCVSLFLSFDMTLMSLLGRTRLCLVITHQTGIRGNALMLPVNRNKRLCCIVSVFLYQCHSSEILSCLEKVCTFGLSSQPAAGLLLAMKQMSVLDNIYFCKLLRDLSRTQSL